MSSKIVAGCIHPAVVALSAIAGMTVRSSPAHADPPAEPKPAVAGRWTATVDMFGTPAHVRLELVQQGDTLSGELDGDKLEGTVRGNAIQFLAKNGGGGSGELKGTLDGGTITGTVVFVDAANPAHPATHTFTAVQAPRRSGKPSRRHDFTPTVFYRGELAGRRLQADAVGDRAGVRHRRGVPGERGRGPQRRHRDEAQQGAAAHAGAGEVTPAGSGSSAEGGGRRAPARAVAARQVVRVLGVAASGTSRS